MALSAALTQFLASVHPYDSLTDTDLTALADVCAEQTFAPGNIVFAVGDKATTLYVVAAGEIEITDETGVQL